VGVKERLSLEDVRAPTLIACEHLHRYQLAGRLCRGMRVLDLACGSGYGSAVLREACPEVMGVDNDAPTIETARVTVGERQDIAFEVADALDFLRTDLPARFDAIVCFEGLEHLPDPEAALTAMAAHASAGMALIISVPNSRAFEEENEFHVTDFGFDEAVAAFSRFERVTLLYQFLADGSLVRREEPSAKVEGEFVLSDYGEPEYANHFIACVNLDERLEQLGDSARMQLAVSARHNRYMLSLERANRELWRENALLGANRMATSDAGSVGTLNRLQELEREVQGLRDLLSTPRHRTVEALRERLRAIPVLDRPLRALGRIVARLR
jgi:SAM-dependent methyltransferase